MTINQARKKYIYILFNVVVFIIFLLYIILNIVRVNENIFLKGTIRSKNTTYIKSPCNIFLQKVLVSPGEELKKGQKLAYIDDINIREYIQQLNSDLMETKKRMLDIKIQQDIYQHQLAILDQSAEQAEIQMQNSEDIYNANQELFKMDSISISDLRASKSQYLQDKTNFLTLQKTHSELIRFAATRKSPACLRN